MQWGLARGALHRRRFAAAVAVVVIGIGLAGCSPGTTDPDPTPTVESSSTATTEPAESTEPVETTPLGPTPPAMEEPTRPAEMDSDTIEGAAATAEYYFAMVDYARTTGDTSRLATLATSDCTYCQRMQTYVEELAASGGWVEDSEFRLSGITVAYPTDELPEYVVYFALSNPEMTQHNGDGTTEIATAATQPNFALGALWTGDGFLVEEVDNDTSE